MSHHWVAALWRANRLKPHRQGTFKVSKDPRFEPAPVPLDYPFTVLPGASRAGLEPGGQPLRWA